MPNWKKGEREEGGKKESNATQMDTSKNLVKNEE